MRIAFTALATLALAILTSIPAQADFTREYEVTCQGESYPKGVPATLTTYDMVQALKAICDDMGGEGSFAVSLEVAVDPRINGRSEQISSTYISENTNLEPWDRLFTATDHPDVWVVPALGSLDFIRVTPLGAGIYEWEYVFLSIGAAENLFGCRAGGPFATCFEYVTTRFSQTNRSFRRLVCPAQYTYVLQYDDQVIGTDATAGQCVWKTYSAN